VGDVNDNQKNYLDSIQIKTNESLVIIEELLDLKRVMKNNGLKIQSIDVKSLIDISISLVIHLAKQKRIAIINKSFNSNELINVDKVLFTQALANILEFAVNQTILGGEVDCYFDIQIEKCQLTINDRSNGLSQVEVDKLNSYENLHDMPSGLLLVRSIINFHGGTFKIQSDLGKGNTYILEIPKK
jgi:two-component system phosphate regulon sensor histidine kinase PhoR